MTSSVQAAFPLDVLPRDVPTGYVQQVAQPVQPDDAGVLQPLDHAANLAPVAGPPFESSCRSSGPFSSMAERSFRKREAAGPVPARGSIPAWAVQVRLRGPIPQVRPAVW